MPQNMNLENLKRDLRLGNMHTFGKAEEFMSQFKPGGRFIHLRRTAIPSCVAHFKRFYGQMHANANLQEAYENLLEHDNRSAKHYFSQAAIFLKLSS